MSEVRSSDGTTIAYERSGEGPALILVDGALCSRALGPMPRLAEQLGGRFTVYTYDRRGRGGSGDTQPYAVEREVEDVEALIDEAGGSAYLFGASSGAALSIEVARRSAGVRGLVLYEAPFIVDGSREPVSDEYLVGLREALAGERRGAAVSMLMKLVGAPAIMRGLMRAMPAWSKLKAVAHTLPYDAQIMGDHQRGEPLDPAEWSAVTQPALVIAGGKSPEWMRSAQRAIAEALPNAELRVLDRQTHMVKAKVTAPVVAEFLSALGREPQPETDQDRAREAVEAALHARPL